MLAATLTPQAPQPLPGCVNFSAPGGWDNLLVHGCTASHCTLQVTAYANGNLSLQAPVAAAVR
jgi:hypothetical protein